MRTGRAWTRSELLVAINIYEKIRLGEFDQRNPVVVEVAKRLNRTPSSVSMKLCNLASLDPALEQRGLIGASKLDREVWREFAADRQSIVATSETEFRKLFQAGDLDEVEVVKGVGVRVTRAPTTRQAPVGTTERSATITARRGQEFFRQIVLNAFESQCCISGITIRELLVASHIMPWGDFPQKRLDLRNGLCLSRIHDGAFDRGLIAFDDEYRLLLSRELHSHLPQPSLDHLFVQHEGRPVVFSEITPDLEGLRYHREKIFRG